MTNARQASRNTQVPTATLEAFDRRLDSASAAPVAVAFSGGGDSLAALILTLAWAHGCGRSVIALTVDHRLQARSGAWTAFAGRTALRLGAAFRALSWDGDKPTHGLSAAARQARHRLIAAAAREAGARAVVFGHTADDLLEGEIMRGEGSTLGQPREWAPSPVWPEGRGLFLLRPLLARRRAELRDLLSARGEGWIDDPANDDPGSARARARRVAASVLAPGSAPPVATVEGSTAALAGLATEAAGCIQISRAAWRQARPDAAHRFLAAAAACAGGGERPPRRDRVEALAARIAGPEAFAATLAGAKIVAGDAVLIARDAGEVRRGGLKPTPLRPGESIVWDGRFLVTRDADDSRAAMVRPLAGHARRLDRRTRKQLQALPAAARGALPVIEAGGETWTCPIFASHQGPHVRSLVGDRLLAACAAISKEPAA